MKKVLISLYDRTGNWSKPYKENGWTVINVDIQNGIDILTWDYFACYKQQIDISDVMPEVFILAAQPCDVFALCGNRHKANRKINGEFDFGMRLVAKTKEIIDCFDRMGVLIGWVIENPASDIHTHNPWMGKPKQKFHPCNFAGYDPIPDNSRYNKTTWLWGKFNLMTPKRLEPIYKDSPIWKNFGGRSLATKNARSITPLGFSYAFYAANN